MKAIFAGRRSWQCIRSYFSKSGDSAQSLIDRARRVPDKFGTLSVESQKWSDSVLKTLDDGNDDDDVETVEFLDRKRRTRLQPVEYARTIRKLLDEKKLEDAIDVLEDRMLKKEKAKPDIYIYNLLISGCARNGETKKAFQLFNQMKKRGLRPKESTYTSLFNACSMSDDKQNALDRAIKLRELMLEKGILPNERTYHAMIKAYGRCGDLERAFAVADEMIDRGMNVSTVTINFLLQSCISNRKSGFRHAVEVWRKMVQKKLIPDEYTFNLLLRCVRDCGFGELIVSDDEPTRQFEAQPSDIGTECTDVVVKPDSSLEKLSKTGAALIKSLKKPWNRLELLGGRDGFLKLMNSASVEPDIKTCSLLIDVLPPSTQIEDSLIDDMLNKGLKIDIDFCNLLIRKRSLTSRTNDAKEVLTLMKKQKLKPNIMTYGVLALACRKLKEAKQLLSDIEDAGFHVNVEIMGGLIKSACESCNLLMLRYLLQELIKQEVTPMETLISQLKSFKDKVNRQVKESDGGFNKLVNNIDMDDWQKFEGLLNKFLLACSSSKSSRQRSPTDNQLQ